MLCTLVITFLFFGGHMIDIKLIRENPELVKENIRKKFQDEKLVLVDEVKALDEEYRSLRTKADDLRAQRNTASKQIGALMGQGKKQEAEEVKANVKKIGEEIEACELKEPELEEKIREKMLVIPNIIDASVPIGKDDSENVEIEQFGTKKEFSYEIPYHTDIMENLDGIDLDSARRTSGNGFYYLTGDIARLHSAILAYARDYMVNKGFTYCIPPFMIRSEVVTGVMSFKEMENMMYKIEAHSLSFSQYCGLHRTDPGSFQYRQHLLPKE